MSSGSANNPMFAALGDEQRKAMVAAFDAMSHWRQELTQMSEANSKSVIEKMSAAAKAVGWPAEFVEFTQKQMQSATKMQSQALEHVMGLWEKQATQQAKSGAKFEMPSFPGMPSMSEMPQFPPFPGMQYFGGGAPSGGAMPNASQMGSMSMMPMQFWLQSAEMWQKYWQQTIDSMMEAQKSMINPGNSASQAGIRR